MTETTETTEFLDTTGGRIAYQVTGAGPLIVLAHGIGDTRGAYRFLVPDLAAAGYRVAAADLRGHGESDTGFTSWTRADTARDLLALIRHLGGPAVVVGHSFAGGSALIAAAEAPQLVRGTVLLAPVYRDLPINPLLMAVFRLVLRSAPLWSLYYRIAHPGHRPADLGAHRAALRTKLREPGRKAALSGMALASAQDAEAAAAHVHTPALIVMGGKDPDFPDPAAEARRLADALPDGARIAMLDGGGHYPHSEYPEQVLAELHAFLGGLAELPENTRG